MRSITIPLRIVIEVIVDEKEGKQKEARIQSVKRKKPDVPSGKRGRRRKRGRPPIRRGLGTIRGSQGEEHL